MTKFVSVEVADIFDTSDSDEKHSIPLMVAIEKFQAAWAKIPMEYRLTAKLNHRVHGDYASAYVDVSYDRPQTAEEIAADEARNLLYKQDRERYDRADYERLKKKYGP